MLVIGTDDFFGRFVLAWNFFTAIFEVLLLGTAHIYVGEEEEGEDE